MRPRFAASLCLSLVFTITLMVGVVSWQVRAGEIPRARVHADPQFPGIDDASQASGPAVTPATPDRPRVEIDDFDFDEEKEDESFWSFSHLDCLIFMHCDPPTRSLSGPRPGHSPPRMPAVSLRC